MSGEKLNNIQSGLLGMINGKLIELDAWIGSLMNVL